MTDFAHSAALVIVIALVTAALRFLPFLIFSKELPRWLIYLGHVLPAATMGMLIIYCMRNVSFTSPAHGLPELLASALVLLVHKWKHNTLLSILGGTVVYMLLLHLPWAALL